MKFSEALRKKNSIVSIITQRTKHHRWLTFCRSDILQITLHYRLIFAVSYVRHLKSTTEGWRSFASCRYVHTSATLYGLFTLQGNGTGNSTGNGTCTIGNNGPWSLSLSQTSVNISMWYYTFHLCPVPVPFPWYVNIPLTIAWPLRVGKTFCVIAKQGHGPHFCDLFLLANFGVNRPCHGVLNELTNSL